MDQHSDPNAVDVVVNKTRALDPIDYEPADLVVPNVPSTAPGSGALRAEVAAAVESMFTAAAADGVQLVVASAFRSYTYQAGTYAHWVEQNGGNMAEADTASARPGFSEHQTGLALDLAQADGACTLLPCFAEQPAGQWAATNAHRFGFIVRYQLGFHGITGFYAEPWHLRYVGVDVATDMQNRGIHTLEEYFGLPAAPGYR
jgi:zinc D-Ala-D-Ala carboxypeptidase